MLFTYVAYIIIWFLDAANQFTTVLNFENAVIAYFVIDVLFICLFALYMLITMALKMTHAIATENRSTGEIKLRSKKQ